MNCLVGKDIIESISPKYSKRIEKIKMSTSAFTVSLGLDDNNIEGIKQLRCGYALLTSGNDAFQNLYKAFENNESALSENCFYLGLSCPPIEQNRNPVLSIQAVPMPMQNWKSLRDTDRERYIKEKEKTAELLIGLLEKYLVPDLSKHIVVADISTPATYSRYSGSPTGSIYDMASIPENFGRNRLPVITPIRGLLLPKFAHGVFGAMNSGLQAVDILFDGKVMKGNSRFAK
jgi:phytoene dehydrogenase-like protein